MSRKWFMMFASVLALVSIAIVCTMILKPSTTAHAQTSAASTGMGAITGFGTCWSADCIIVSTNAAYVDNGCGGTSTAQYATAPGAGGNTTIHATLMGAFLAGKKIQLVVQGCVFGHPQIIGVGVQP